MVDPAAEAEHADDLERRRELVGELVLRLMLTRRAPVTLLLAGIMVGVYGLSVALGGATEPEVLAVLGAKVNHLVAQGEWWRLVSSVFVHVGVLHLVGNGYALFFLGRMVENGLGRRWFLVIFVRSGVGGALASFHASPHPSAGASGAVFGVMGGAIASGFKHRRTIPPRLLRQLAMSLLPWLALALSYGFVGDHVDNAAHLGGLGVGLALGAVASSPLLGGQPEGTRWVPVVALNLTLGSCLGLLLYGALGTLASLLQAVG